MHESGPTGLIWILGTVGLASLAAGFFSLIRPRRASEVARNINQLFIPWRLKAQPVWIRVAEGCFFLLLGAALLYATWAILQR